MRKAYCPAPRDELGPVREADEAAGDGEAAAAGERDLTQHRLPQVIAGFFYMAGTSEHERDVVKQYHATFVSKYGFPVQHNPPLLELDLQNARMPLRLVPMEHEWSPGQG